MVPAIRPTPSSPPRDDRPARNRSPFCSPPPPPLPPRPIRSPPPSERTTNVIPLPTNQPTSLPAHAPLIPLSIQTATIGRYTTVQAYADNSGSMRAISYDQATVATASAAASADRGPVVTGKVDNPYGSVAGAGSGEFHVYRHARAREMARWKEINANEAELKAEEEFQKKILG